MTRLLVLTVGKTHSGKSTFAQRLAAVLTQSVVIDQDHHARFINEHYRSLLPKDGPNRLKMTITQAVVEHAIAVTDQHLILCNANLNRGGRRKILDRFAAAGFTRVIVSFEIPDTVIEARIEKSQRPKDIFRQASSFWDVLSAQNERLQGSGSGSGSSWGWPKEGEAEHFLLMEHPDSLDEVVTRVLTIAGA